MDEVTNVWEWPGSQCGSGIRTDPDYWITSVGRCSAVCWKYAEELRDGMEVHLWLSATLIFSCMMMMMMMMRSTECRFLRVSPPAAAHPSSSSSSDPSLQSSGYVIVSRASYADFCVYRKHHAFLIRLTDPSRRHCWISRIDWLIDWLIGRRDCLLAVRICPLPIIVASQMLADRSASAQIWYN